MVEYDLCGDPRKDRIRKELTDKLIEQDDKFNESNNGIRITSKKSDDIRDNMIKQTLHQEYSIIMKNFYEDFGEDVYNDAVYLFNQKYENQKSSFLDKEFIDIGAFECALKYTQKMYSNMCGCKEYFNYTIQ